jgi:hypothetical protein
MLQTRYGLAALSTESDETQKYAWMQLTSYQEQFSTNDDALFAARIYKWHNFHGFPNDAPTSHKRITSCIITAMYFFLPMWESFDRGVCKILDHTAMKLLYIHAVDDPELTKISNDDISSYLSVIYCSTVFTNRGYDSYSNDDDIKLLYILYSFLTVMWKTDEDRDEQVLFMDGYKCDDEAKLRKYFVKYKKSEGQGNDDEFKEEFTVNDKKYVIASLITINNDVIESYVKRNGEIIHASDGETRLTSAFPTNPSFALYIEEENEQVVVDNEKEES